MEAILLIGIQATGKTGFYLHTFFDTHVRISLDMLRTRHRERLLFKACLEMKQPFVIDNTNPTLEDRARYIGPAKQAGFRVVGYYFASTLADALKRNEARAGKKRIPVKGIAGTAGRLQVPKLDEGFDALFYVRLGNPTGFIVKAWRDEF